MNHFRIISKLKVYMKRNFRYAGYCFIGKNSWNDRVSHEIFFYISSRSRDKTPVTSQVSMVYIANFSTYWKVTCIFKITESNHLKLCMWIETTKFNSTVNVLWLPDSRLHSFQKVIVSFVIGSKSFRDSTGWAHLGSHMLSVQALRTRECLL